MGFFSILYWLVGHPKRHLAIYSQTNSCAYSVIIKEIGGNLTFTINIKVDDIIKYYQPKNARSNNVPFDNGYFYEGETGTRIILEAREDPFTKQELKQMYKQLHKLEYLMAYYPNLKIELDLQRIEGETFILNAKKEIDGVKATATKNIISIEANIYSFSVGDKGSGIPIQILLSSLLIPAVSTKGLKLQNNKDLEFGMSNLTTIQYNATNENELNFLVSGLVIAKIKIPKMIGLPSITYTIDFPRNTRLPVSRDDIILTPEIEKIFRNGINKLFNLSIQGSGSGDIFDVNPLQKLLEKYSLDTPGDENKRLVREELDKFYNENKGRLVPANAWKIYNYIATYQNLPIRFIASNRYDSWEIEGTLDKYAKSMKNIWLGFNVILIPSIALPIRITEAGLNKYLFVNKEYVDVNPQTWINNLALSYTSNQLYPYSKLRSTIGVEDVRDKLDFSATSKKYPLDHYADQNLERKYDKEPYFNTFQLGPFDKILRSEIQQKLKIDNMKRSAYKISELIQEPDIIDIFFIVLSKYTSINKTFFSGFENLNHEEIQIRNIRDDLLFFYTILTENQYRDVLSVLLNKMSSFKGNQTYGGATYKLTYVGSDNSLHYLLKLAKVYDSDPNVLPQKTLLYSHILSAIKSVQESEFTILSLCNRYSPGEMALNMLYEDYINYIDYEDKGIKTKTEDSSFVFLRIVNQLPLNLKEYTYLLGGAGKAFANYRQGSDARASQDDRHYFNEESAHDPDKLPPDYEIRNYINYVLNDIRANHLTDSVSDLYNLWQPNLWINTNNSYKFIENYSNMTTAWLKSFREIIVPVKSLTDVIRPINMTMKQNNKKNNKKKR
jgi:hypothetical protein